MGKLRWYTERANEITKRTFGPGFPQYWSIQIYSKTNQFQANQAYDTKFVHNFKTIIAKFDSNFQLLLEYLDIIKTIFLVCFETFTYNSCIELQQMCTISSTILLFEFCWCRFKIPKTRLCFIKLKCLEVMFYVSIDRKAREHVIRAIYSEKYVFGIRFIQS